MPKVVLCLLLIFALAYSQQSTELSSSKMDSTSYHQPLSDSASIQITETLLGDPVQQGVYAAPVMKFSRVGPNGSNALVVGAQGGWILDHKYVLGLGVYGLSNVVKAPKVPAIDGLVLIFNYGGLLLSYIHNSHKLVHFEASNLFGIGEANYRDQEYNAKYNKGDTFVVAEPSVQAILNVTRGFRLGVGLSYRYVTRLSLLGMSAADLSGVTFNIMFRVGNF